MIVRRTQHFLIIRNVRGPIHYLVVAGHSTEFYNHIVQFVRDFHQVWWPGDVGYIFTSRLPLYHIFVRNSFRAESWLFGEMNTG